MKKCYLKGMVTCVSVAAALLACPAAASAATDMFLKLGDIKGESVDAKHKGEIDVLAWSWGESDNTAASRKSKGGATAPDCIQDLSLTKFIDSATPDIVMDAVLGQMINHATLTLRRASGIKELSQEYLTLALTDVTISAYATGGSGGEDRLTENVTLHFQKMEGTYRQQLADGSLGAPITWTVAGAACR